MRAKIYITLKNGVLDPQGKATQSALKHLGFESVAGVRQGKLIEMDIVETDRIKASAQVESMCKQLLANSVIENFSYDLVAVNEAA